MRGFLYTGGELKPLDPLGDAESDPFGLNDLGAIVGVSLTGDYLRPFVRFPDGQMFDLRAQTVGIDYRQILYSAVAINNHGWIAVTAYAGPGLPYSYLLKPGALTVNLRQDGQVEVRFGAPPDTRAQLEHSSDLRTWTSLGKRTLTEDWVHIEPASHTRFFRGQVSH